jgi:hypothetical protein
LSKIPPELGGWVYPPGISQKIVHVSSCTSTIWPI